MDADPLVNNWLRRCVWCGWPLASTADEGCVEGNCSMRIAGKRPPGSPLLVALRGYVLASERRGYERAREDAADHASEHDCASSECWCPTSIARVIRALQWTPSKPEGLPSEPPKA